MKSKILNIQGLYLYTILNYIDKSLNFLIPFLVLKIIPTQGIYAELEYILSISIILSSFLDLGLRSYLFYGYKRAIDKQKFCVQSNDLLIIILSIYLILYATSIPIFGVNLTLFFCVIRSLFLTFINVKSSIFRLEDKPTTIFFYSSIVSILIALIIVISFFFKIKYNLFIYSLPYILFCIIIIYKLVERFRTYYLELFTLMPIIKKSFLYSWPLAVTLIMTAFQNNFAKLYGYNQLPVDEFESFAVFLRFFMLLLLAHTSAINYYTKAIYSGLDIFNYKIYLKYISIISMGLALMISSIFISNHYNLLHHINLNIDFYLVLLAYIFMMNRTFAEQYFGKYNKLKFVLFSSSFAFVTFLLIFGVFYFTTGISITKVLLSILISEFVNFLTIILGYKKIIKPLFIHNE